MGALCAFIQRSKTRWLLGMAWPLLLFAGAAFSHETAVLFPLVIAAYVFLFETTDEKAGAWPGESASLARRIVQAAARSSPFLGVALLYMAARAAVLGPAGVLGLSPRKIYLGSSPASLFQPHPNLGLTQILMTIPTVLVNYVELLVFPWLAGPAHDVTGVTTPSFSRLYVPVTILVLLALLGYLVFRNSPRSKLYLFCVAWSLVALAPALSFNHVVALVQDRYLYLASFAFCLWLATCATQSREHQRRSQESRYRRCHRPGSARHRQALAHGAYLA